MPTRYRDVLSATSSGQLTVTKHLRLDCLMVFPRPEWEKFAERLKALPADADWIVRKTIGWATDVELDGTGRVLVAPELRTAARIERDVLLLGVGRNFELWDRETYAAAEAVSGTAPMPDSLKNFTF